MYLNQARLGFAIINPSYPENLQILISHILGERFKVRLTEHFVSKSKKTSSGAIKTVLPKDVLEINDILTLSTIIMLLVSLYYTRTISPLLCFTLTMGRCAALLNHQAVFPWR